MKSIVKQNKSFNPLAPAASGKEDEKMTAEREMRDLIKTDVRRTC